ncbi:MAG: NAD-dependent malic enzyme [Firmicutes bacterium]|nr:NAD-dependent malic enzyme [Bacillota bacterium]
MDVAISRLGSIRVVYRLRIDNGTPFADVYTAVANAGGEIVAMDMHSVEEQHSIRDITVTVHSDAEREAVTASLAAVGGVHIVHVSDRTFLVHLGGKIGTLLKVPVKNRDDLSMVYTPGVARVSQAIHEDVSKVFQLTIKRNTVAVVTDGSAVLGLGNIGPEAALPVMEGKAMLFKQFADIDAFPICLATQDVDQIVETVMNIAPVFGGINLEDISSPRCFAIEEELRRRLDIPVFHDDQHGTAVVLLAGLMNAVRVCGKRLEDLRVVVVGIGAAGVASTRILLSAGVRDIVGVDRAGAIVPGESYDNPVWRWYAEHTNPRRVRGGVRDALRGADVFIGVSGPGVLEPEDLDLMAADPIVFAMANPTPEVDPERVVGRARVIATGRSDYPNQINNVLAFPGMFKGALACRAREINEEMKLAAARAIAGVVGEEELSEEYIVPSVFNRRVAEAVAHAVEEAAYRTGVARRERRAAAEEARAGE